MNAVYVGASKDLAPIRLFKSLIKRFIYVDVHGLPSFVSDFQIQMKKIGFRKCDVDSKNDLDVFVSAGGTELYYFKNQAFPNVSEECAAAISTASALICCRDVDLSILKMMKSLDRFIGNSTMNYAEGELCAFLYENPQTFAEYIRFQFPRDVDTDIVPEYLVTRHASLQDLYETTRGKLTL